MSEVKQAGDRPIHYWDVRRRRISCGATAADEHSTKHVRSVTCQACIGALHDEAVEETRTGGAANAGM